MALRLLAGPEMLAIEREWPVRADLVTLIRSLANDVYQVAFPRHFLRVYRRGWRPAGEVGWEAGLIAWRGPGSRWRL